MITGIVNRRRQGEPLASITASIIASDINEGDEIVYTITTENIPDGTTLYWSNFGTTSAADFIQEATSGTFVVNNSTGTVTLSTVEDMTSEGTETIVFSVQEFEGVVLDTISHNVLDSSISMQKLSFDLIAGERYCSASTAPITYSGLVGGNPPYSFSWSNGSNQGSIDVGAGTHTLTISDTPAPPYYNGDSVSKSVTFQNIQEVTFTHTITGNTVRVTPSGGTSSNYTVKLYENNSLYQTKSSTGGAVDFTMPSLNNSYKVIVSDSNQCTSNLIQVREAYDPININSYSTTNVTCYGGTNGTASFTVSGGGGSLSYAWTGGVSTSNSANNLSAGTYTMTVSDSVGQSISQQITITQPSEISLSVQALTGNDFRSIRATASGGSGSYTYTLSIKGTNTYLLTNTDGRFYGLDRGQEYDVSVVDSAGCTLPGGTISWSVPSQVTASISYGWEGCRLTGRWDASVTNVSGGSGAYTYTWGPNLEFIWKTASGRNGGEYYVVITDENDPSNDVVLDFKIDKPESFSSTASRTVDSLNLLLGGGIPPYTYTGDLSYTQNGNNNFIFTGLDPNKEYHLDFVDSTGCTTTRIHKTADFPTEIESVTVEKSTCYYDDPLQRNGSITVTWTGGYETMRSLQLFRSNNPNDANGANSVKYIGRDCSNGGTTTLEGLKSYTFTELSPGYYYLAYDYKNEIGNCVNIGRGTGPSNIYIQEEIPFSTYRLDSSYEEPGTIFVFATDHASQPKGEMFPVTVGPVDPGTGQFIGPTETINEYYTGSGPTTDQYIESGGDSVAIFRNLDHNETYYFGLVDATGCVYRYGDNYYFGEASPPPPALNTPTLAITQPNCGGGDAHLAVSLENGGVKPYTYEIWWQENNEKISDSSNATWKQGGTLYAKVTDAVNQTKTSNTVQYAPFSYAPSVLPYGNPSYTSQTINVNPTGSIIYWDGRQQVAATNLNTLGGLNPGTEYTATVTDGGNCSTDITFTTLACDINSATVNVQHVSCYGINDGRIEVNHETPSSGGTTYSLNEGPEQNSNVFAGLSQGTYIITVHYAGGACQYQATATVTAPSSELTSSVSNVTETGFTVTPSGGTAPYTISYNSAAPSTNFTYTTDSSVNPQEVNYTVFDNNGCFVGGSATPTAIQTHRLYTTSQTLDQYTPSGASTFCELAQEVYTTRVVRAESTNLSALVGTYLYDGNLQPITFYNGQKIAINRYYGAGVQTGHPSGSTELTFGPGGIITGFNTIMCDGNYADDGFGGPSEGGGSGMEDGPGFQ